MTHCALISQFSSKFSQFYIHVLNLLNMYNNLDFGSLF